MTARTMLEQEYFEQLIAQSVDETTANIMAADWAEEAPYPEGGGY